MLLLPLLIVVTAGCVLAGGSTPPAVSVEAEEGKVPTEVAPDAGPVAATIPPATSTESVPTALPTATPSPAATALPAVVIARPQEIERGYIPNPGMGWQDSDRPRTRFPETVGYGRYNWSTLNPAEGTYDWSSIEALRAQMRAAGGQFSFRVRTVQPEPWGPGLTAPQWVIDLGLRVTGDPGEEEPVYSTCLFLEKHASLIDELRKRYDGDPEVAYIDIGSYGFYGEWDSPQYDPTEGSLDWHTRRRRSR